MTPSAFALALLFTACSKSSGGNGYHITCKIDGVSKSFNYNTDVEKHFDSYEDIFGAAGFSTSSKSSGELILLQVNTIQGATIPLTKTYYCDTLSTYTLFVNYQVLQPSGSISYNDGAQFFISPDTNEFKMTVTSIDSSGIKAIFSGNLYSRDNQGNTTSVTVTDGDLYEKFQN